MCQERVAEFQTCIASKSQHGIKNLQDSAQLRAVENNRNVLRPIIDTILLCARQNILFVAIKTVVE